MHDLATPTSVRTTVGIASSSDEREIPLIYVVCKGRSGSTLTALLMSANSRIIGAGEVESFHKRFSKPGHRRCTCGEALDACPFWADVQEGLEARLGERVPKFRVDDDATFLRNNEAFFASIQDTAPTSILLDKSKKPGRLDRLLTSKKLDITIVHVVRDVRAVAYSFQQRGERKDRTDELRYNFLKNIARWAWLNSWITLRYRRHPRYLRVRYEDLVADPEKHVRALMAHVGVPFEDSQMDFGKAEQHAFSGNRMRLQNADGIRPDTKYIEQLPRWKWWVGSLLAFPVLRYFGYPIARPDVASRA